MKHDPSTYIGIGKDGFRAIEPRTDRTHDFSRLSGTITPLPDSQKSFMSKWLLGILIFGFVCGFLAYFHFLD